MSAEGALDPAVRLEAALDRIAQATDRNWIARTGVALLQPAPRVTTPAEADIVARLDALIADLRSVLGTHI